MRSARFLENSACQESRAEATVNCSDLWFLPAVDSSHEHHQAHDPKQDKLVLTLSFPDVGCTYITSSVSSVDIKRLLLTCQSISC